MNEVAQEQNKNSKRKRCSFKGSGDDKFWKCFKWYIFRSSERVTKSLSAVHGFLDCSTPYQRVVFIGVFQFYIFGESYLILSRAPGVWDICSNFFLSILALNLGFLLSLLCSLAEFWKTIDRPETLHPLLPSGSGSSGLYQFSERKSPHETDHQELNKWGPPMPMRIPEKKMSRGQSLKPAKKHQIFQIRGSKHTRRFK